MERGAPLPEAKLLVVQPRE